MAYSNPFYKAIIIKHTIWKLITSHLFPHGSTATIFNLISPEMSHQMYDLKLNFIPWNEGGTPLLVIRIAFINDVYLAHTVEEWLMAIVNCERRNVITPFVREFRFRLLSLSLQRGVFSFWGCWEVWRTSFCRFTVRPSFHPHFETGLDLRVF